MSRHVVLRTWPYGTRKRVKVLNVVRKGAYVGLVCHCDEDGEGYIVTDGRPAYDDVRDGDTGMITFKQGGPTGGYWLFEGDRL